MGFVDHLVALANEHDREVNIVAERAYQESRAMLARISHLEHENKRLKQENSSVRSLRVHDPFTGSEVPPTGSDGPLPRSGKRACSIPIRGASKDTSPSRGSSKAGPGANEEEEEDDGKAAAEQERSGTAKEAWGGHTEDVPEPAAQEESTKLLEEKAPPMQNAFSLRIPTTPEVAMSKTISCSSRTQEFMQRMQKAPQNERVAAVQEGEETNDNDPPSGGLPKAYPSNGDAGHATEDEDSDNSPDRSRAVSEVHDTAGSATSSHAVESHKVSGHRARISIASSAGEGSQSPGSPSSPSSPPSGGYRHMGKTRSRQSKAHSTALAAMAAFMEQTGSLGSAKDNMRLERAFSKAHSLSHSGPRRVTWNGDANHPFQQRRDTGMSLVSNGTEDEHKLELHFCWHYRERHSPSMSPRQGSANSSFSKFSKQRSFDIATKDFELLMRTAAMPMWERLMSQCVVQPSSPIRHFWDVLGVVMISYAIFFVPFQCFDHNERALEAFNDVFFTLADIYWTLDIALSFLSGFNSEGAVDMRVRRIAWHYVRGWFAFDLLAVLVDWIALVWRFSGARGEGVVKALRVIGFLRVLRLRANLTEVKERINSDFVLITLSMVKLVIIIIVLNHLIACSWYGIGLAYYGKRSTWLQEFNVRNQGLWMRYSTSLHWSLTQFTPASMEVYPQNPVERSFAILVLVFAMITFSSFISSITNAMKEMQGLSSERKEQFILLRRYLRENLVSGGTMVKIWTCLESTMQKKKQRLHETDVAIMQFLPVEIRTELFEEIYSPAIEKHPFFMLHRHHYSDEATLIYENALTERTLLVGKPLFNTGEVCDRMYFVLAGELHFIRDHGNRRKSGLDRSNPTKVDAGWWISEPALWMEWYHTGQVTAGTKTELLELDVIKFQVAMRDNEDISRYANYFWERFKDNPSNLTDVYLDTDAIQSMANRAFTDGLRALQPQPMQQQGGRRISGLLGAFQRVPRPPPLDVLAEEEPKGFMHRLHKQSSMLFGIAPKTPNSKGTSGIALEETSQQLSEELEDAANATEELAGSANKVLQKASSMKSDGGSGTAESGKMAFSSQQSFSEVGRLKLPMSPQVQTPSASLNRGGFSSLLGMSSSQKRGGKRTSVAWS